MVELIVVLVILAILAAILVPALLGYIDKAKQRKIILNGSYAYKAAQSLASERYGMSVTWTEPTKEEAKALGEFPGDITTMTFTMPGVVDNTEEKPFCYTEDGMTAKYADGVWTVEEASGSGSGGGSGNSGGTGDGQGFSYPNNLASSGNADVDKAMKDFCENRWEKLDASLGDGMYKVVESADGTKYILAMGNGISTSSVAESLASKYSITKDSVDVQKDGSFTNSTAKEAIQQYLSEAVPGYSGNSVSKLKFDYSNKKVNAIEY